MKTNLINIEEVGCDEMNEKIKEKALELYQNDYKYKDIAKELDISVNTFKSWVRRYGLTKNKGAPKQEKVHPKKVGPPKGSRNALGNSGGAAPKQNKNAVKTGEYETIYSEYLTDEEKSLF